MAIDPSLGIRIKSLSFEKGDLSNQRSKLMSDIAEVQLLKIFLRTLASSGYDAAVADLPQDNPDTPQDETVTVEDLEKVAERFKIPVPANYFEAQEISEELEKEISDMAKQVHDKIKNLFARASMLQSEIDEKHREILFLRMLQQSQTAQT